MIVPRDPRNYEGTDPAKRERARKLLERAAGPRQGALFRQRRTT